MLVSFADKTILNEVLSITAQELAPPQSSISNFPSSMKS